MDPNVHTRITLPPPEWAPAAPIAEAPPSIIEPVARREGRKAEEATLRAAHDAARASGDGDAERRAATELARHLASREHDLDEAVELGLAALDRCDDVELRKEVASWLEMLGEPGTAAMVLRKTTETGASAAATMVRVGVLLARAGDGRGASTAFEDAAKLDQEDATPLELRGTLARWADEAVDTRTAARCFAEAAGRRKAAGSIAGEMEDALRAFEADESSEIASQTLETALRERGKTSAAEHVARAHALALEGPLARRALVRIVSERLGSQSYLEALGASIDAQLDRVFSGEDAATFDGILLRLGLLEALAARLEVRVESASPSDRRALRDQLARLYSGPLGSATRAAQQHVRMIAEDPGREESLLALREYAEAGDRAPLVEALVRGTAATGDAEARAHCARALAVLAEETLRQPMLAQWAYERLQALATSDARVLELTAGLGDISAAVARLAAMANETEHRQWQSALTDALARESHNFGLGRWLLRQELTPPNPIEARAELAAAARQRGDAAEACTITAPLSEVGDGSDASGARAASIAWVNAALAGDMRVRAKALECLATFSAPGVRALLLACASDDVCKLAAGDEAVLAQARSLADAACQAEPSSVRGLVALANASLAKRDRNAASILERAVTAVYATRKHCEALADALEALGEHDYAVAWTQRLVALRPGDVGIIARLVARIARVGDAARLMDVIMWLLPQPLPSARLAPLVANALDALALLDVSRAATAARRALDTLGPRNEALTEAMARTSERDTPLTTALLSRRIGTVAAQEERVLLLLELAELHMSANPDEALRALAQAILVGADPTRVAAAAEGAHAATSADAEIWRARIRATALESEASSPASRRGMSTRGSRRALDVAAQQASNALRSLGALQWDMAGDARRAVDTWLRAARMAPSGGYAALGVDLARFAGAQPALEKLQSLVAGERDPMRSGAIAAEAARASLAIGAPVQALELAEIALVKNPLVADAIELAERAALAAGRVRDVSRVYDALGARARGRFGRRAAHYRGARFFDQRGEVDLALKHAAQAFAAVPSEGGTFFQLARIAERAGDVTSAVRTIEEVADAAPRAAVRAGWLLRAAQVAGTGDEGVRMRVDMLLKAAFLQPMPSTLALLGDAARELLVRAPEERSMLQVRFSKARRALARKLEGPDGARVAIAFTRLEIELFDDAEGALESFARALESDADLEEYVLLTPLAPALGKTANARDVVVAGVALLEKPFSNVGVPALRFLGALADAAGDVESAGRMRMAAAERESDDDELVRAADLASRTATGPGRERFEAKVSAKRRIAAHQAFVGAERQAGRFENAVAALERIAELSPEARPDIDAQVRATYELAGRAEELERRALSVAEDAQTASDARVEAWLEVAQLRERRGDVSAAVDSLRTVARLDPAPLERWSQLERVSALAGNAVVRAEALNEIEARVAVEARPAVLRRLAHTYEEAGDLALVEATWHRILALRPDDEEADFAIEELLARQNNHTRLAEHLEKRAERLSKFPERRDMLRVVRLRRAAILEQRLGLLQQACDELERVVAEWPNNDSALRYLGDLLERQGNYTRAVEVYRHLAAIASEETWRCELLVRAATAARRGGDRETADELVRSVLLRNAGHTGALVLLGELARERDDHATVAQTLVALAASPTETDDQRSDWLIEAAQAAARSGNVQAALEHAQKAALLSPRRGATQLFARGLEYRLRQAGTPDQAKETLAQLDLVTETLAQDDAALAMFLRAEALDVAQGGDAGLRYLEHCTAEAQVGSAHALVHVGLAERLAERWRFAEALPQYEQALGGHTLGLRAPHTVAIAAADVAVRAEKVDTALAILEQAAEESVGREEVLRQLAHVAASANDLARARRALEEILRGEPKDRATVLASLGRLLFTQGGENEMASEVFREAIAAAPEDTMLRAQLEAELGALAMRGLTPEPPEPSDPKMALDEPTPLGRLASTVAEAPPGAERTNARAALARAHLSRGDVAVGESLLLECLSEGDIDAGEQLAVLLESDTSRTSDLLRVRRLQVEHNPGDLRLLTGLRNAALQDHNPTHARAIEHVLRAFDIGAGPLPPPPLSAQLEQQGMLQLLARPALDSVGEALALVWDGGSSLLARDAQSYALTGVERIAPGPHSALARLYELASRLLGTNVPLYARRQSSASNPPPGQRGAPQSVKPRLTGGVALLRTLSAMVLGDVREDAPALRYALGQAFAATLPQSALLLGLPEVEGRVVWNAMLAAFGAPEYGKLGDPAATRLVQAFWNTIPPRSQRRLQEVLARAPTDFDAALDRSRQSGRRIALFLCGDIAYVLRVVAAELALPEALLAIDHFGELVESSPIIADLVRIAVSAEYADARFRPMPAGGPRATLSSGRFKIL